jgi:hypothetical protein
MPNHCTNRLVIGGPAKDLRELVELMKGESPFDFNKLDACPQELTDTSATMGEPSNEQKANLEKYGHKDWYSWNCAHWGTKWNAYSQGPQPEVRQSATEKLAQAHGAVIEAEIEYGFDTAWSPPIPIIENLVQRFPTCRFTHDCIDEGGGFSAHIEWSGGNTEEADVCDERDGSEDVYGLSDWHERFRGEEEDEDEDEDEDEE